MIPYYSRRTIYAEGVCRQIYPTSSVGYWTRVADAHPADEMGTRRLVRRQFYMEGNRSLCIEDVLRRVPVEEASMGWELLTAIFMEGLPSPFPWHYSNCPPPLAVPEGEIDPERQGSLLFLRQAIERHREEDAALAARHAAQDELSRIRE